MRRKNERLEEEKVEKKEVWKKRRLEKEKEGQGEGCRKGRKEREMINDES